MEGVEGGRERKRNIPSVGTGPVTSQEPHWVSHVGGESQTLEPSSAPFPDLVEVK